MVQVLEHYLSGVHLFKQGEEGTVHFALAPVHPIK